ncbi:homoserine kinase [Marinicella rhabdoformis]|uniref:homoserine kinase n=1 Tax=Marinicella rhabdoformis TaxID=2580566 RepID=UPI0012AECB6A|nr:homoserine kinase [Marinicella rhabdoformis]
MKVSVFAPISVGNVGVGFDSLGLALEPIHGEPFGDVVHVDDSPSGQDQFTLAGSHAHYLPSEKEKNIVWFVLQQFKQALSKRQINAKHCSITLEKNIPVSSGLGSSACSVVAAFVALNNWYQKPFNEHQLLYIMGQAEAEISGSLHYDNVAPCYLGGMQLMLPAGESVTQTLPNLVGVYWVIAYPDVVVSTQAARALLPDEIERATAIQFAQHLAGFVDACHRGDKNSAFALMKDVIAEPHRESMIPKYKESKAQLLAMGSLSVGISGSGPTLFSVCDDLEKAKAQADWLAANYLNKRGSSKGGGFVSICQADVRGARQLKQQDAQSGEAK